MQAVGYKYIKNIPLSSQNIICQVFGSIKRERKKKKRQEQQKKLLKEHKHLIRKGQE